MTNFRVEWGVELLGETVRRLRREQQMTLQNLADATGLSAAILSQLENDQGNPTLLTLRKIAKALDTSIFALLADVDEAESCVKVERKQAARTFSDPRFNTVFELLSVGYRSNRLQSLRADIEPGMSTCDEPMAHGTWDDEEWTIVLDGEVLLEIGNERHELTTGDCVHFHPALAHRYSNTGVCKATLVSVVCPPSF